MVAASAEAAPAWGVAYIFLLLTLNAVAALAVTRRRGQQNDEPERNVRSRLLEGDVEQGLVVAGGDGESESADAPSDGDQGPDAEGGDGEQGPDAAGGDGEQGLPAAGGDIEQGLVVAGGDDESPAPAEPSDTNFFYGDANFYVDESQIEESNDDSAVDVGSTARARASLELRARLLSTLLFTVDAQPQPGLLCLLAIAAFLFTANLMLFAKEQWRRLPRKLRKQYRQTNPAHFTVVWEMDDLIAAGYVDPNDIEGSLAGIDIPALYADTRIAARPLLKCHSKTEARSKERVGGDVHSWTAVNADSLTSVRNKTFAGHEWTPGARGLPDRFDEIATAESVNAADGAAKLAAAKAVAETRWLTQNSSGEYLLYDADNRAVPIKLCSSRDDMMTAVGGDSHDMFYDTIYAAGLDGLELRNLATDKNAPVRPAFVVKSANCFTTLQLEGEKQRIAADGDARVAVLRREAHLAGEKRRGRFDGTFQVLNAQGVFVQSFATFSAAMKVSKGGVRAKYPVDYRGGLSGMKIGKRSGGRQCIDLSAGDVARATEEKTRWNDAFTHGWYDDANERYLVYVPNE